MKKNLLTLFITVFTYAGIFAQTAPDFTATDCNGNSHNLYTELNTGKVIVLNWVMPCSACVGPSLTAYNIVQSYASPNVLYYLMDDAGNTVCTSLATWATSSGIGTNRTTFSTSAIVENNYGGTGMPHVVVVGANHTIYFNGLNTAAGNVTAIQNAINTALSATGIVENTNNTFQLNVLQPANSNEIKVNYFIKESSKVSLEIVNEIGQSINKKEFGNQAYGPHTADFDISAASNGIYFMRLTGGNNSQTVMFSITK